MSEIVVQRGIPVAHLRGRQGHASIYPFAKMGVGDSFVVPVERRAAARMAMSNFAKRDRQQRRFATRTVTEDGVVVFRIWRVE